MRLSVFSALFFLLLTTIFLVAAAPHIGLGSNEDFILWKLLGLRRGLAISYPAAFAFLLCTYQLLSLDSMGCRSLDARRSMWRRSWEEGGEIARRFFIGADGAFSGRALPQVTFVTLVATFTALIFIYKSIAEFGIGLDQHWHQAMVDYDVDWRTPLSNFAGNLFYQFGIQFPFNTGVMPLARGRKT